LLVVKKIIYKNFSNMQLPEAEIKLFYKLYNPLLLYTAQKTGQAKNVSLSGEIKQIPFSMQSQVKGAEHVAPPCRFVFVCSKPNCLRSAFGNHPN
jgi:hypothetical protein